ncbi:MAG: hypothetical protein K8H88_34700 [Sandaracinaceae bacterium]|nr:hypothetical protein [Sandaracinaceae bacterium]
MVSLNRYQAIAAATLTLAACGGTPGARPHDMSRTAHEEAATGEEREAAEHQAQYDARASAPLRCGSATASALTGGPCWSVDLNPTQHHAEEARRHREAAAAHRAASAVLRDAEGRACAGIDEAERDMSPFAHRDDIRSVEPLRVDVPAGRQPIARLRGATVTFRAVQGMTVEWLQRSVDCHLARNAALGHDVPEMEYCPLVPNGVTARVRSVGDGFAVDVRANDDATAQEILRRAGALAPGLATAP